MPKHTEKTPENTPGNLKEARANPHDGAPRGGITLAPYHPPTPSLMKQSTTRGYAFALSFVALALLMLHGCTTPMRQNAVPQELTRQATIPDMPTVRYRIPEEVPAIIEAAKASFVREKAHLTKLGERSLPPVAFLALSGGGDNGAFGAGLLNGWTAAGTRPEFKLVTGISTGALIAPFAFLGPAYDGVLKHVYTDVSKKDILKMRSVLAAITNDAIADSAPLGQILRQEVNATFLAAIAAEHAKGRLLLIGTTDLDARQPVIWNMGEIAASGHPKALELFQSIMIASASIPGVFPPVMVEVEADGRPYQEMHVDGGTVAQVFVYPAGLNLRELARELGGAAGVERQRSLYLIRNARLDPDWAEVDRLTYKIAGKAIASLLHSQGIGDLYRIYLIAQRDGVDYNLAYIPPTFKAEHTEDFDTEYMRQLYALGYELAVKGYAWQKTPPGYAESGSALR
jgi:predicted acylesterase/phospholipase RssA